jgi:hypothetical protein
MKRKLILTFIAGAVAAVAQSAPVLPAPPTTADADAPFRRSHSTLFARPENQAQSSIYETNGSPNGRVWTELPEIAKLAYVRGFDSGASTAALVAAADADDNATDANKKKKANSYVQAIFPVNLTFAEIVKAINEFYEEPLNGPIAISNAVIVVTKQARGTAPKETEQDILDLRRKAGSTAEQKP